jgi:ubiquinone/menaquinone biosynthesis C-methylase UbiE
MIETFNSNEVEGSDQSRASRFIHALQARLVQGAFRCPTCHGDGGNLSLESDILRCHACGSGYPLVNGILAATPLKQDDTEKDAIKAFWHELYENAYAEDNARLSRAELVSLLANLEALFRQREHLAVNEMPLTKLRNADVLEIGSGNGAHSALFALLHGARMTSVDITPTRVLATSKKLDLLAPEGGHLCLQADAETLPFSSDLFDVVYSNGVLHHTTDTARAIGEVYRVLKPGGLAVIMLYAKHSFQYWINLVIGHGILRGQLFRGQNWVGRSTEWMATKPQKVFNPITRVYSAREIHTLFSNFTNVRVRKNSFQFRLIPGLEQVLERSVLRTATKFEGGRLVYGFPFRAESPVELWLGRHIGFGLNIVAEKPTPG